MKEEKNLEDQIYKMFKTCSWLLFELLDIHPFGDGNGRLCRLLCSYALSSMTPFPTPIYNVWSLSTKDDYERALVNARKSEKRQPTSLATMIIENNYHGWKKFFELYEKVLYGLPDLPLDMVKRPVEVKEIFGRLEQRNSRVCIYGEEGLGKTVLALAVASVASGSRQVIWLDIGEKPDRSALMNILIKVLGGEPEPFKGDIHAAQSWIKANRSDKDCLIVIDDVRKVDDVAVFECLPKNYQLLITTRDAGVVRGLQGSVYELQFMDQDKSRELLYQSARVKQDELSKFSSEMHSIVDGLLKKCRGLPLALSSVGSNLIDTRSQQDWKYVLEDLPKAKLEELG